MAEYKNGVNFRGNMSVEADDISPDVKTGRIVFVDDDLYESDTAYKAKVDKCVEEGFVKSSDIGSGGGGGGGAEPLVVYQLTPESSSLPSFNELVSVVDEGKIIMINMTREVGGKPVREQYTLGFLGYNSDESMYIAYGVGTNVDGLALTKAWQASTTDAALEEA